MSRRHAIADEQWTRIKDLLPGRGDEPGRPAADNRLFIDAVLWIAKTGVPWRDLPERFGNWNSVFRRFSRWAKAGVWKRVLEALAGEPDLELLILDTTIVRAHAHAAGAPKNTGEDRRPRVWAARAAASAASCTYRSMPRARR